VIPLEGPAVAVDGHDADLPASLRGAMAVKDARHPTLLVLTESEALAWEAMAAIAHAHAQLVEQPSLAAELQLAVIQLGRLIGADPPHVPTIQEFAQIFGVHQERVAEICRVVRSAIPVVLESLRPVLWHVSGPSAVAALPGPDDSGITEATLLAVLTPFSASLPMSAKRLLQECGEKPDLGTLRDRLGISYADFNGALKALGPPLPPDPQRRGPPKRLLVLQAAAARAHPPGASRAHPNGVRARGVAGDLRRAARHRQPPARSRPAGSLRPAPQPPNGAAAHGVAGGGRRAGPRRARAGPPADR
jgi:hypothetical protein